MLIKKIEDTCNFKIDKGLTYRRKYKELQINKKIRVAPIEKWAKDIIRQF